MERVDPKSLSIESQITIGNNISLSPITEGRRSIIVTDKNIEHHFSQRLKDFEVTLIPEGEKGKSLSVVASLYDTFLEKKLDRNSVVIGVGGGAVTDTAGFAAATFLRGIDFVAVPTTLLGQADASIGGKSGVNFRGFKNLIGTVREPKKVICDVSYITTLSDEGIANGAAELIKHGAILDIEFLNILNKSSDKIFSKDVNILEQIVKRSIDLKLSIVFKDREEKGPRRLLNFGHTLGHAFEATGEISHGEAISIGMMFAAEISVRKGLLDLDKKETLRNILSQFKLPTEIQGDISRLMEAILHDKKRVNDSVHMALLEDLGKGIIMPISLSFIEETLSDLCKRR